MNSESPQSALVIAPGARAAQARLFAEIGAALERRDAAMQAALAAGDAPAIERLLARPLRVVVPSRALRDHVSAALLRHFGRSLVAVVVSTHRGLALTALERADEPVRDGEELFRLLVQRFAAQEPLLAAALGELREGYGIALATARDLVDAGFTPELAEALDDLLGADPGAEAERMRAVARVTARALVALEQHGLGPRAALLQRACERVGDPGAELLPTAALWIHGFADATGVVADWIETLVRRYGARVIASAPPDPFRAGASEAEFSKRFVERIEHAVSTRASDAAQAQAAPALALLRAPGAVAEPRAVALQIRALLDAGVAPESIGVVARALEPHRAALDANFTRLAIPFSAPYTAGSRDAQSRRLGAVARLLADAGLAPVETWLDASMHAEARDGDLRVGLHVLGAGRLEDLVQLDLDAIFAARDFVVLPVRHGSSDDEDEEEGDDERVEGAPTPRRAARRVRSRTLGRDRLELAQRRAREIVALMQGWPEHAPFARHTEAFARLETLLGWEREDAALAPVHASFEALGDEIPAAFALTRAEFASLVDRALERVPGAALGGQGAGVQVLPVMSARGLCFDALFVLGLQREVFPRTPSEDPIVSDALRRAMRDVLPELPVKGEGRAEERHLFAELLSASPQVNLSWQYVSDEGRELARSSFVARLCLERADLEVTAAPPALGRAIDDSLRPAHEHALRAALYGPRAALAPIRSQALREVRELLDGGAHAIDAESLARVQVAILDEIDPDPRTRAGRERAARLGPYFGYIGRSPRSAADPEFYVTRLEAVARCPWQAYLRRDLRLEPAPDALDALPALSPLAVGNVVHAVLQRVVDRALGVRPEQPESLADALARGPVRVPWPEAVLLESIAAEEANEVASELGVRIAGFARALARRALAMVDVARALDWSEPDGLLVLGAELAGEVVVHDAEGRARRIGFRVDRVDLLHDGLLRLTDYKSGNSLGGTSEDTRRKHLAKAIAEGRALQSVAYLAAGRALGAKQVEGRLLYLREDLDDRERQFVAPHDDEARIAAFEATARTTLAAIDAGTRVPRLVMAEKDEEPQACKWCEVAIACLRGESGQRARLRNWSRDTAARRADPSAADRALFAAFALGARLEAEPEDAS